MPNNNRITEVDDEAPDVFASTVSAGSAPGTVTSRATTGTFVYHSVDIPVRGAISTRCYEVCELCAVHIRHHKVHCSSHELQTLIT